MEMQRLANEDNKLLTVCMSFNITFLLEIQFGGTKPTLSDNLMKMQLADNLGHQTDIDQECSNTCSYIYLDWLVFEY